MRHTPSPPPKPAAARRRASPLLARFRKNADGMVAVEWAMVAIPFFAIIGAIIDVSLTSWVSQNLNNAASDAARTIQTDSFQSEVRGNTNTTEILDKFRQKICAPGGNVRLYFISCDKLKVQIKTYSTMAAGQADSPIDSATGDWASNFGKTYNAAGASTIVVIQVAAKYPMWMNVLKVAPTFSDGSRLLQSTVVLKTEPF